MSSLLDDILKNVIRSRGFRDTVPLSQLLARPDNAGLIIRRPTWHVPPDLAEPGMSFTVKTQDTSGVTRRLVLQAIGSWPILTQRQNHTVAQEVAAAPAAWCLVQHNGRDHWIAFSVSVRYSVAGRMRMARAVYQPKHGAVAYAFRTKTCVITIAVSQIRLAVEDALRGRCRTNLRMEGVVQRLPELCRVAHAMRTLKQGARMRTRLMGEATDRELETALDYSALAYELAAVSGSTAANSGTPVYSTAQAVFMARLVAGAMLRARASAERQAVR